ncbi:MAG: hypothetical protein FJ303_21000 [Planctomycetes bacterium]|nr:hypothetical protein [Planctomycetota bacterium]
MAQWGIVMPWLAAIRWCVLTWCVVTITAPDVFAQPPADKAAAADVKAKAVDTRPQGQLLDQIAAFFRHWMVNIALVTIGVIGLIFEFKLPGTTLPGSVAAFCFVMFFWAHACVGDGAITLLAIMLFLLGLVFLAIEVFVVPGLGFSGVAGVVLMFVGLLLVTLEHWPTDQQEWTKLGSNFGSLAIAIALAIAGATALTWALPTIPFLNAMVLKPPSEPSEEAAPDSMVKSGIVELLGAIGVAVTPLKPSGKAQFGAQFLDVIAEGTYINPGTHVQVIEIEGTRIVVKEV